MALALPVETRIKDANSSTDRLPCSCNNPNICPATPCALRLDTLRRPDLVRAKSIAFCLGAYSLPMIFNMPIMPAAASIKGSKKAMAMVPVLQVVVVWPSRTFWTITTPRTIATPPVIAPIIALAIKVFTSF